MTSTKNSAVERLKIMNAIAALEAVLPLVSKYVATHCDAVTETGQEKCQKTISILNTLLVEYNKEWRYGR